ncbi:MAG: hypothetical protein HY913_00465 [Desulfomonile tiedjei]|nr:hypothetical protein [Desulfomonile tiedjei]
MDNFKDTLRIPGVLVTAVGSLPHSDAGQAVDMICKSLKIAPHAPQLSASDPREQMWIQYTEGLPRFKVDLDNLNYFFDTSGDPLSDVERFYEGYFQVMEGAAVEDFAIGPDYGRGIHAFLERLRGRLAKCDFIKVQVTGPLSFGLTVTDENRKPIFYHPLFRDVAVKGMGLKAVWLLETFKPFAENVIVFFDEPSLSAYGSSAFLGVSKSDVIESLDDVISMVADRGGIAGVHCCGNTDWGILMETATRIINFDAVDYMGSLAIYAPQLAGFLERGGVLAWGAVPNTEKVEQEAADDIIRRIKAGIDLLERSGLDRGALTQRLLVTPACGCAGLTVGQTETVYARLSELEERLSIDSLR